MGKRIPYERLVDFGTGLLAAKGIPLDKARCVAEAQVLTEAFGVTTHGLSVLLTLREQVGEEVDPAAEPIIARDRGPSVLIDARGGFGQVAMVLARRVLVRKAQEHGIAAASVRNSPWMGAAGTYLISLAQDGFLALLFYQYSRCQHCPPFGGMDPKFSTNPIGIAIPTGGDPIIADFSTAALSIRRVGQMQEAGRRAPEPIFLDAEGNPTDDPNVMGAGGAMFHVGGLNYGHKGYALALLCEALAAAAGGSANNPELPGRHSYTLIVMDPEGFAGRQYFLNEVKRLSVHVKASRPRPGFDAVRLPGERGFRALREARGNGVPLDDEMIGKLNAAARDSGLDAAL